MCKNKQICDINDVQFIDAFNDNRAEIIGVIYPDIIDDQLKHLLFHEAKVHNKKLVILDKEFMLQLLDKNLTHGSFKAVREVFSFHTVF